MTAEKQQHIAIIALLSIGAIVVLVYLTRRSAPASTNLSVPDNNPPYPAIPDALKLGDVSVGDNRNNTYLTINAAPDGGSRIPTTKISGGSTCPCENDCSTAQGNTFVTSRTISQQTFDAAARNLTPYRLQVDLSPQLTQEGIHLN